MNLRKLILLGLVIGGVSLSRAATILERDGTINAQCCQFAAIAINWTMDREWTNVKIEMDFHNGGDEDDIHTGVALLLDSLGPGTTPANKIDDIVLVEHERDAVCLATRGHGLVVRGLVRAGCFVFFASNASTEREGTEDSDDVGFHLLASNSIAAPCAVRAPAASAAQIERGVTVTARAIG